MTKQDLNYWMMYHEVHHLKRQGCSTRKICEELVLNFRTAKKYLSMTEDDFFRYLEQHTTRYKKLATYEEFVKEKLGSFPETSSAQMHDWLKEHHADFPKVNEKTVFNFVQFIRQKYNLPRVSLPRQYFPVDEPEYGHQAQVDFGECTLRAPDGSRRKVYFFTIVLSRSRQKYAWFADRPFTTLMAIEAHERSFAYFQGIPGEIVYDQDKVFLHNENKGNLLLTKDFKSYTAQRGFNLHFCRKADPQSKGKIENVVKYVKQNFLYNRTFTDVETLNDQAAGWLSRTANVSVHNRTRKVPFYEWQTEKTYLKPYLPVELQYEPYHPYHVRKDNTIAYKGNFYTLPQGSYKNKDTVVLVRAEEEKLCMYTPEKSLVCSHPISEEKGKVISNSNHKRDNSLKIEQLIDDVSKTFEQPGTVKEFLRQIQQLKPRYIRDQVTAIQSMATQLGEKIVLEAIHFCIEKNIYDAIDLKDVAEKFSQKQKQPQLPCAPVKLLANNDIMQKAAMQPITSNITDYEKLMLN
jgi:transposase